MHRFHWVFSHLGGLVTFVAIATCGLARSAVAFGSPGDVSSIPYEAVVANGGDVHDGATPEESATEPEPSTQGARTMSNASPDFTPLLVGTAILLAGVDRNEDAAGYESDPASASSAGSSSAIGDVDEPRVYPSSARKIEQLTGDLDAARGISTASRTAARAGVVGTDLGSSFEHDGKLVFLFGDTVGGPQHADVLAWTQATSPEGLELSFHTDPNGKFVPLAVPGVSLDAFEIPSYGISLDGVVCVVFTTDHSAKNTMGRSILATSKDGGRTFERSCDVSSSRFINVAMARASSRDHRALPTEDAVLVWGSGRYRASSPRLAFVPVKRFTDRSAWQFWAGTEGGRPAWTQNEADSADLFDHPVVGELSVAWITSLRRWVMLYNSSSPRGIVMRTAREPWGPWSAPQVAFDPWLDGGYAQFMHVEWKTAKMDTFHDPSRQDTWGGEYGPYLIPRFTTGDARRTRLVFTMSTWNPYQVVTMSVDVGSPGDEPKTKEVVLLPGSPPFVSYGSRPVGFQRNGRRHVRTYAANGDADLFVSHVALTAQRDASLAFQIHGGHGRVVLVQETKAPPEPIEDVPAFATDLLSGAYGRVVESVAGPSSNDVDVSVRWSLDVPGANRLRLYVIDPSRERWGFLSVSEMTVRHPVDAR